MTQSRLALAAVVPRNVVVDFEVSSLPPKPAYLEAIREVLERTGVEFTNGGEPGVKLKSRAAGIPAEELNASNDE